MFLSLFVTFCHFLSLFVHFDVKLFDESFIESFNESFNELFNKLFNEFTISLSSVAFCDKVLRFVVIWSGNTYRQLVSTQRFWFFTSRMSRFWFFSGPCRVSDTNSKLL